MFFTRYGRACFPCFRAGQLTHLCQSKIQDFGVPSIGDKDVGRFNIAVNDALGMGRIEGVCNIDANIKQTLRLQRTCENRLLQCFAVQVLHHDERASLVIADFVDGTNIGMIQSRCRPGFAPKTFQRLIILGNVIG